MFSIVIIDLFSRRLAQKVNWDFVSYSYMLSLNLFFFEDTSIASYLVWFSRFIEWMTEYAGFLHPQNVFSGFKNGMNLRKWKKKLIEVFDKRAKPSRVT